MSVVSERFFEFEKGFGFRYREGKREEREEEEESSSGHFRESFRREMGRFFSPTLFFAGIFLALFFVNAKYRD